jgi:hypothetical protein
MRLYYRSWEGWMLNTMVALHGVVRGSEFQHNCAGYARSGGRIDQQRLREAACNTSTRNKNVEEESIMGWGEFQSPSKKYAEEGD